MICISRNTEIPQQKPHGFCAGCEQGNREAFSKCLEQAGGVQFSFCDGTKVVLFKGVV